MNFIYNIVPTVTSTGILVRGIIQFTTWLQAANNTVAQIAAAISKGIQLKSNIH